MNIQTACDNGFILQPCPSFCNGCTVYEERPKQCATFECQLLKSVDEKELAFDTATVIVSMAKSQRATIEKRSRYLVTTSTPNPSILRWQN